MSPTTAGALDGLRIIEWTGEVGVWAGKLLADMGADVIKIEPPQGGEPWRPSPLKVPRRRSAATARRSWMTSATTRRASWTCKRAASLAESA